MFGGCTALKGLSAKTRDRFRAVWGSSRLRRAQAPPLESRGPLLSVKVQTFLRLPDVALSGFKLDQMADSAKKGFVAVPMNPEEHPKCQAPPPPYSGRPEAGPSPPPYLLQPCSVMSCSRLDTVQLTVPTAPQPKDYVLWSLFNAMLCNFYCLGFAALAFSVKSRDRLVMKDVAAARRYGDSARRLNVATVAVGIVTIIFFFLKVGLVH